MFIDFCNHSDRRSRKQVSASLSSAHPWFRMVFFCCCFFVFFNFPKNILYIYIYPPRRLKRDQTANLTVVERCPMSLDVFGCCRMLLYAAAFKHTWMHILNTGLQHFILLYGAALTQGCVGRLWIQFEVFFFCKGCQKIKRKIRRRRRAAPAGRDVLPVSCFFFLSPFSLISLLPCGHLNSRRRNLRWQTSWREQPW